MTFISIPNKTYHGVVSSIADTGKTENNSVTFGVTIQLTDADELVMPGMTADIKIPIAKVSDVTYLPIQAVRLEDGETFVNRIEEDGSTTKIPVKLGVKSGSFVEVISDELSEGMSVETSEKVTDDDEMTMRPIIF